MNKYNKKKIFSIISTALSVIIFLISIYVFVTVFHAKKNNAEVVVFGRSFFVVVTDSMAPEIEVDELIVSKAIQIEQVQVGDNVVFRCLSGPLKGQPIIHKVIEVGSDSQGAYIITQGVKQGATADSPTRADNLIGLQTYQSMFLGRLVKFFSNPFAILALVVLLIIIPIIVKLTINIIALIKQQHGGKA